MELVSMYVKFNGNPITAPYLLYVVPALNISNPKTMKGLISVCSTSDIYNFTLKVQPTIVQNNVLTSSNFSVSSKRSRKGFGTGTVMPSLKHTCTFK